MQYSNPNQIHLGATVRDTESGTTGTLTWLDCHPTDRGALIETEGGTYHTFVSNLELLTPRMNLTPVAPERLNRSGTDGWGIVPEYAAVRWLEPRQALLQAAA